MNANLLPKVPATIKSWLTEAEAKLEKAGISSARLDAELILAEALQTDRTWLLAHSDEQITSDNLKQADEWLARRVKREPLAYIRGWIEFYGRRFAVDKRVLIPRPETEEMIQLLKSLELPEGSVLIDVGTGSGCLAITTKLEHLELEVHATDISVEALEVARQNAKDLGADIEFQQSDLLSAMDYELSATIITANLPYVDRHYTVTPEADAEPALALYADDDGHALIERLIPQASKHLHSDGYLILESDPWQQTRIIASAAKYNLHLREQRPFHLVLQKHYLS
jgi:release factor glutamine methyltransferase